MNNTSRVVVLLRAILVLTMFAAVKCGGGMKGDGPGGKRGGKSLANELAAAAADTAHDASLAAQMQAEEDKKSAQNNSGGYSDAAIARDLQEQEEAKVASTKKRKVMPSLIQRSSKSKSTNGTVSFPGPSALFTLNSVQSNGNI